MTLTTATVSARRREIGVVATVTLGVLAAYLVGSARAAGAAPAAATAQQSAHLLAAQVSPVGSAVPAAAAGITVDGSGTVSGTPDALLLSLSVTAGGTTVSAAFATANEAMAAVQRSLREHGIAARDLKTSDVSAQTRYTSTGVSNGFSVSEGLTATLRSIGSAGAQISAAVSAGGNLVRVDSVSLDLSDSGPLLTRARDEAFADAKGKAEQYAKDAGRSLGSVLSVSEQVPTPPQPFYGSAAAAPMSGAFAPVPIQAGTQAVAVTVTVTFGLGQPTG